MMMSQCNMFGSVLFFSACVFWSSVCSYCLCSFTVCFFSCPNHESVSMEIIQISQSVVCQQEDMLVTVIDATATRCLRNISSQICFARFYLNVKFPVQNVVLPITWHVWWRRTPAVCLDTFSQLQCGKCIFLGQKKLSNSNNFIKINQCTLLWGGDLKPPVCIHREWNQRQLVSTSETASNQDKRVDLCDNLFVEKYMTDILIQAECFYHLKIGLWITDLLFLL